MQRFMVHAKISRYDATLKAITSTNSRVVVEAKGEKEARSLAKRELYKKYNYPLAKLLDIYIDLVVKLETVRTVEDGGKTDE